MAEKTSCPPNGRKRTKTQREFDLEFIGRLALRGVSQAQITEQLAAARPYRISRSQVRDDIALLLERWQAAALELRGRAMAVALQKLDALEAEAWDGWDRSKTASTRTTLTKRGKGGENGSGEGGRGETRQAVSVSRTGDPAFISRILEVMRERAKLLGLEAPDRHEFSGPGGGPIEVAKTNAFSEEEADAVLVRHYQRWKEDEEAARKAAVGGAATVGDGGAET